MSEKESGNYKKWRWTSFRRILACLLTFLFIVLLVILIVWLALRPSKPSFILQDVTVFAFNATVPNFLTSSFQVTIYTRNPNDNVGIYYSHLDTYVTYRHQQVTYRTAIPPTYQGHNEVIIWSPFVHGTNIPVAPYSFVGLRQDQYNGIVHVVIKIGGRVRWKVGAFISSRYYIHVRCPAVISFGPRSTGITVGNNAVKYQLHRRCTVSV